jgi:hypothetical protein
MLLLASCTFLLCASIRHTKTTKFDASDKNYWTERKNHKLKTPSETFLQRQETASSTQPSTTLMSIFEPSVILSILKNAPSQLGNKKEFEIAWEKAVCMPTVNKTFLALTRVVRFSLLSKPGTKLFRTTNKVQFRFVSALNLEPDPLVAT